MNIEPVLARIDALIENAKKRRDWFLDELVRLNQEMLMDGELTDLENAVARIDRLKAFRANVVRSYEE